MEAPAPSSGSPPTAEQKLMIARQPIYNGQMGVYGYELLFRPPGGAPGPMRATQATAQVLATAILGSGLHELVYDRMATINVTRAFLDVMQQIQLPASKIVLDLPDNLEADDALLAGLTQLKDLGYTLSIGGIRSIKDARLMGVADNLRIDVKQIDPKQLDRFTKFLQRYKHLTLRALKIETLEEYDRYQREGYDYFQGYFLGSPRAHQIRELTVSKLTIMELLAAVHDADATVADLEEKIVRDVSLSLRLLKLVNSPFFALRSEVDSVKRAVVLLGRDEIRKLVSLLALSSSGDQPKAMIEIALMRAKVCELLAAHLQIMPDGYFTVGMFSALDILMEQPIRKVISGLPLAEPIKAAILQYEGQMGEALACALAMEQARWGDIQFGSLSEEELQSVYREALHWTYGVAGQI